MTPFLDRVLFLATAAGTVPYTVSGPVTGYQTPGAAGVIDGFTYNYMAQSADLSQWEIGQGVYNAANTSISRVTVYANSSGTTTTINFSAAPIVSLTPLHNDFRMLLTADTTFYIRSDGNDNNSGLVNSASGAWATLSKAMSFLSNFVDAGNHNVTLSWPLGPALTAQQSITGAPANCPTLILDFGGGSVATSTTANCIDINFETPPTIIQPQNVTLSSSGGGACIRVEGGPAGIQLGAGVTFGATTGYHIWLGGFFSSTITSNYTVNGGAAAHIRSDGPGASIYLQATVTFTGNVALNFTTAFVYANGGQIASFGATFTLNGTTTVTGSRYSATGNGVINTFGGGANYFPGNSAGTTSTGGQYL